MSKSLKLRTATVAVSATYDGAEYFVRNQNSISTDEKSLDKLGQVTKLLTKKGVHDAS